MTKAQQLLKLNMNRENIINMNRENIKITAKLKSYKYYNSA